MRARIVQVRNGKARIVARRTVRGSGHASTNAMLHVLARTLRARLAVGPAPLPP